MKKIYYTKKDVLSVLIGEYKEIKQELEKENGKNYPERTDFEGWKLYGRMQGLAWCINLVKKMKKLKTKIFIERKLSKDIKNGEFVVIYAYLCDEKGTPRIRQVERKETLIHNHKYILVDLGDDYDTYYKRFYDFDNETFDVIVCKR